MDAKGTVTICSESGTLLAVPAVHFQADFALEINRICCDPARRPEAIAVELGHLTAAAGRRWLGELGIGPGRKRRLPCMLGLVRRNRHLRPSTRERALGIQRESGRDLGSLPPTLLYEELGLSSSSVLVLSPTDSIVEAIRCACELDLPLYGVDLEEMACPIYPHRVLPDPAGGNGNLSGDLRRLAAHSPVDPEIDPRRELAMAARLKGLLQRHGRVLFTGGMAHWDRIERHLSDKELEPSVKGLEAVAGEGPEPFRRVVIHPAMAVAHMDAFPAVALVYERHRRHPLLGPSGNLRPIRRGEILRTLLRRSYRRHFSDLEDREMEAWKRSDWSGRNVFEQLLHAHTLLSLRSQPTLGLVDACARATMSDGFCAVLRRNLASFPWVDAKTVPECGHLRPALTGEGGAGTMVCSEAGSGSGDPQVPAVFPGGSSGPEAFPTPKGWRETVALERRAFGYRFTWRPWEDLINGLCGMAIAKSLCKRRETVSEPCDGQLLDGIDVKATVRGHSRGEERVWVRDARLRPDAAPPDLPEGFPVVWIFDEVPGKWGTPHWSTYFEPADWLADSSGDPAAFRRLLRAPGDGLLDLVTYERPAPNAEPKLAKTEIGHNILSGLVVFSPIFPTYRQTVCWYQATGASRNPVAWCWGAADCESTVRDLAARTDPAFRGLRWQDLLIGMAIPFAGATLTVVAPEGFTMAPVVARGAARRGKIIRLLPTSGMPADLMRRVVQYHTVPGRLDANGRTEYISGVEKIIGEPLDRFRHLVPPTWRDFGLAR